MPGRFLVFLNGDRKGERIPVERPVELGRDVDGVGRMASSEMLSRRHAIVTPTADGHLEVTDLGSRNGTWVDGVRVESSAPLREGSRLGVGDVLFEVQVGRTAPLEQTGTTSPMRRSRAATVLHAGRTIVMPPPGLTIGRRPEHDIVIDTDGVSRDHARIATEDGRHYVLDLGSRNGTFLNGERLVGDARWLRSGDTIEVGGEPIRYLAEPGTEDGAQSTSTASQPIRLTGEPLGIGRDAQNALVLDAPTISRFHAEIIGNGTRAELRDLASRNGTRLDGRLVSRAPLVPGSEIGIGPFRLIFDGVELHQRDERGALRLDAFDITVRVKERTILDRASLSIQPGELVAIIGESGSGKTTLMRVLVGSTRPSGGLVLVNGEPLDARLSEVGYLPQDEIVHPRLTVVESLRYSARLRLPHDSSSTEIADAVGRALDDTSLTQHAHTRIGLLSGGQRKRVGLATELLSRPGLLFLDEPTTGLDPGLETRMMEVFRQLASVGSRALLVVTHATRNLELVDRLLVMGRGGHPCFLGAPDDARTFFGVRTFDDIYAALEGRPAEDWRREFEGGRPQIDVASRRAPDPSRVELPGSRRRARPDGLNTRVLSARYARVFVRDRRNLLLLTLQAPLIGLVMALLFDPDVFGPPGAGLASSAAHLLFVLVVTTIWLGAIASAREIIKERPVFERERAVGIGVLPYLASKLAVLFPLVAAQAALLLAVVLAFRPLGQPFGDQALLFATLALTGFAAVAMGLTISAAVSTEEQAMALIPVAMIVELLFGGALVTVRDMGAVMAGFSAVAAFSRWGYATVGGIADMNERIAGDPAFRKASPYGADFFALPATTGLVILGCFVAVFVASTAVLLRRR